ncbi:MAG: DUF2948 family protein [Hyphomicrobiaceae bacterium]
MTDLKLIAFDEGDLDVLSAHLQDSVVKVSDLAWLPRERRFVALLNRFDWASANGKKERRSFMRKRTALRFERVESAQLKGIDPKSKSSVLELLAIGFQPGHSPSGVVTLIFAGGAAIRLDVECIEAELKDLGAAWRTRRKPEHGVPGHGEPGHGEDEPSAS